MSTADIIRALRAHARFASQIHGPAHWARVHRFGVLLAERAALPPMARACVEVFAWVHDLAREDDGGGNQHAIDGAASLDQVVAAIFHDLSPPQIETIRAAVRYHSDGMVAGDACDAGAFDDLDWPKELVVPTIGCCWDADRLDLPRVGIYPRASLMSTSAWREVLQVAVEIHTPQTTYDPRLGARQAPHRRAAHEAGPTVVEIQPPPRRRGR